MGRFCEVTMTKRDENGLSPMERLDVFGIEAVEECLGNGMMMAHIAKKAGVGPYALTLWLQADSKRLARAKVARQFASEMWDAMAEEVLNTCDIREISRARELAQHYRWRSSKLFPRSYGDHLSLPEPGEKGNIKVTFEVVGPNDIKPEPTPT